MRTSKRRDGLMYYAPEDGDYNLFLSLLRQWVREAEEPINDRDLENFAQDMVDFYNRLTVKPLRTSREWLKLLKVAN